MTDLTKMRAALLEQKSKVDSEIAAAKVQMSLAKSDARVNGRYMDRTQYANLELRIKRLAQKSQSIQNELSKTKRSNFGVNISDCFREAAKTILDERTFVLILSLAHDIQRAKEQEIKLTEEETVLLEATNARLA